MNIVPLYYFAADLAKRRLQTGDLQLGTSQPPQLLLAGTPVAGKMPLRDLSHAPLLAAGGPRLLPGMLAQTQEALQDGEHLILMSETVLHSHDDAETGGRAALLIWVGSSAAQMLGVNPILQGDGSPSIEVREPAALPAAPGQRQGTLFPAARTLH